MSSVPFIHYFFHSRFTETRCPYLEFHTLLSHGQPVPRACSQSLFPEPVPRACSQSLFPEPVPRACSQSLFPEPVPRACSQSLCQSDPVHLDSTLFTTNWGLYLPLPTSMAFFGLSGRTATAGLSLSLRSCFSPRADRLTYRNAACV